MVPSTVAPACRSPYPLIRSPLEGSAPARYTGTVPPTPPRTHTERRAAAACRVLWGEQPSRHAKRVSRCLHRPAPGPPPLPCSLCFAQRHHCSRSASTSAPTAVPPLRFYHAHPLARVQTSSITSPAWGWRGVDEPNPKEFYHGKDSETDRHAVPVHHVRNPGREARTHDPRSVRVGHRSPVHR